MIVVLVLNRLDGCLVGDGKRGEYLVDRISVCSQKKNDSTRAETEREWGEMKESECAGKRT